MTISRSMKIDELPHLLTMSELGQYLPIPRSSLYALVRDGRLEGVPVGRRIMVKTASLRRLLNEQEHKTDTSADHQELASV